MLRALIKSNIKAWEDLLPHVEFAYNRAIHSSTKMSPFMCVYGTNPLTPFDLIPFPCKEKCDYSAENQVKLIKDIHEKTRERLENLAKSVARTKNKFRRELLLKEGDLVWVHLRKERFPNLRTSKLSPRGDGPFKVIKVVGDNAYVIDLPEEYGVNPTFNIGDLTLFEEQQDEANEEASTEEPLHIMGGDGLGSGLSQEGGNDAGASLKPTTPGAITRAMSKKIQDLIRQATLAQELEHDLDPMASTLLACERVANPQHIQ